MTYQQVVDRLAAVGIPEAKTEARLILQRLFSVSSATLYTNREQDYSSAALDLAIRRRQAREPLAYILGSCQFYRQTYEVTPDCLIPRSDTELLVECAIKMLPKGACFADLCTGSGCIAISVLAERPDTSAYALELSQKTLALASKNASANGVADRFFARRANVLSGEGLLDDQRLDAILSNPPYIPTETVSTLAPEVKKEPSIALDGGKDGMDFYRAILTRYPRFLKSDGFLLLEIGYDEGAAIHALATQHGFSCSVHKDLGGNDRLAILTH